PTTSTSFTLSLHDALPICIAFKANIDDLRESPSKDIAVALTDRLEHGTVLVVEPNIDALPREFEGMGNVELADLDDAVERADIVDRKSTRLNSSHVSISYA